MKFTGHETGAEFLKYFRVTAEENAIRLSKMKYFNQTYGKTKKRKHPFSPPHKHFQQCRQTPEVTFCSLRMVHLRITQQNQSYFQTIQQHENNALTKISNKSIDLLRTPLRPPSARSPRPGHPGCPPRNLPLHHPLIRRPYDPPPFTSGSKSTYQRLTPKIQNPCSKNLLPKTSVASSAKPPVSMLASTSAPASTTSSSLDTAPSHSVPLPLYGISYLV